MITVSAIFVFNSFMVSLILFIIGMGWWKIEKREILLVVGAILIGFSAVAKLALFIFREGF